MKKRLSRSIFDICLILSLASGAFYNAGCASLFGWDIHAPGILSESFTHTIHPTKSRVGLYLDPRLSQAISRDRGSALSDPQTYHIGEALYPMLIEGFQEGFEEFVFLEVEPTPDILKQYGISYLATVEIKGFDNQKGKPLSRQSLTVVTNVSLYNAEMGLLRRFDAKGSSDTRKVFAKKGGPEVNLNAAIENNILATIQFLQDVIGNPKN